MAPNHMFSSAVADSKELAVAREVVNLLNASKDMPYIGEAVTQVEHMTQAAYFAEHDGAPETVIVAALCHDLGHICVGPDAPRMGPPDVGVEKHEDAGAEYLRARGFPDEVCQLVRAHVAAKRYLVTVRGEAYYESLSPASRQTLEFQGGRMTEEELKAFEADPLFEDKVRVRKYDELSKVAPHPLYIPPPEDYIPMIVRVLLSANTKANRR